MTGNTRFWWCWRLRSFVVVDDTPLMNVSISAAVGDLDTTVSSVQSAIALEALGPRARHHSGTACRPLRPLFRVAPTRPPAGHGKRPGRDARTRGTTDAEVKTAAMTTAAGRSYPAQTGERGGLRSV